MKTLFLLVSFFATSTIVHAETTIKEKLPDSNEDTSVLIQRKVNPKIGQDKYEIVSDEEEIVGEPTAGTKESYAAWKTTCNEWKKETRENNKENQIIKLSCGIPHMVKDGTGSGVYTYESKATMKVKVKTESAQH